MNISMKYLSAISLAAVLCSGTPAWADAANSPGIITWTGTSATVATKNMPEGSEMWAMLLTLPPGKKTGMPGPDGSVWMELDVVLTGSVVTGIDQTSIPCVAVRAGGKPEPIVSEGSNFAGDSIACDFSPGSAYWDENRGTEVFSRAQLNIGGPFIEGSTDTPSQYLKVGGDAYVQGLGAYALKDVATDLKAAGAMTVTIRTVNMPPSTRMIVADKYPALRLVSEGSLTWGDLPAGAEPTSTPAVSSSRDAGKWLSWVPLDAGKRYVLANETSKPVRFVEWSVVPAPGATP